MAYIDTLTGIMTDRQVARQTDRQTDRRADIGAGQGAPVSGSNDDKYYPRAEINAVERWSFVGGGWGEDGEEGGEEFLWRFREL